MSEHLDLDALADLVDDDGTAQAGHVAGCASCQAALTELRTAVAQVSADLAALPRLTLPEDVRSRIAAALPVEPLVGSVTTLPTARTPFARRWLPAAAAVVLLLAGAGYGISRLGGSSSGTATSSADRAAAAAPAAGVVRNSTGTDYTGRASLVAAVPQLLQGSAADVAAPAPKNAAPLRAAQPSSPSAPDRASGAQGGADPLARLRDNAGLAECLLALLPAEDPSVRPLALDYGSFQGTPAMIVVLPSARAGKLDVFVVGAACSRANDSTLFYTSVDKP